MGVRGLGYIVIDVGNLDGRRRYAELLGTRVADHSDGFAMKIDDRPFRLLITAHRHPADQGLPLGAPATRKPLNSPRRRS